ncbi:hypothetical protein [Candidatus Pantoea multigeneris]|uniref:Uncharacterized protein n=1 Tax=Candidatus Pantoea multigeneris TaxID=2608357 RepID=A0ABX0R7Q0_9GAMM|nr:hypothetical protein [Pantoea multigeneris]NIF21366.1 hypothetical protein [Pantoea multigeneris]
MTFVSLTARIRRRGRILQSHHITATQSRRQDSGTLTLNIRFSRECMEHTGILPGVRADILHDADTDLWKVKIVTNGGLSVFGHKNQAGEYSSCAISITLQEGFPTISSEKNERVKMFSIDAETVLQDGEVTFRLGFI